MAINRCLSEKVENERCRKVASAIAGAIFPGMPRPFQLKWKPPLPGSLEAATLKVAHRYDLEKVESFQFFSTLPGQFMAFDEGGGGGVGMKCIIR